MINVFHCLAYLDPHSAARTTILGTVQKQRGKWGGWLESTPYEGDGHSISNNTEEAGDRCVRDFVSFVFLFFYFLRECVSKGVSFATCSRCCINMMCISKHLFHNSTAPPLCWTPCVTPRRCRCCSVSWRPATLLKSPIWSIHSSTR